MLLKLTVQSIGLHDGPGLNHLLLVRISSLIGPNSPHRHPNSLFVMNHLVEFGDLEHLCLFTVLLLLLGEGEEVAIGNQ